jgi:hypothetical protein
MFSWNNNANIEYPEDLTWDRSLNAIFYAGVIAGRKTKTNNEIIEEWEENDE